MNCRAIDFCKYLKALDYTLDSEIGDLKMFKEPNSAKYVTLGTDNEFINNLLLIGLLDEINKTDKDLEIFLDSIQD